MHIRDEFEDRARSPSRYSNWPTRMPKQAESKSQASARHFFYIADGQPNLGFVAQDGDAFTAKDVEGRKIGVFESLKAASNWQHLLVAPT